MCIRDRDWARCRDSALEASQQEAYCWFRVRFWARFRSRDWRAFGSQPVSYTHLTLPTICSV
eukprot:9289353-Alexandrium_andersonii.AAC.1